MTGDLTAFLRARCDEDERYLRSNKHHLWTKRPLREVAAKRAILAAHMPGEFKPHREIEILCRTCVTDHDEYLDLDNPDPWPCATVRALAAVYSDHPDYRAEWKP